MSGFTQTPSFAAGRAMIPKKCGGRERMGKEKMLAEGAAVDAMACRWMCSCVLFCLHGGCEIRANVPTRVAGRLELQAFFCLLFVVWCKQALFLGFGSVFVVNIVKDIGDETGGNRGSLCLDATGVW